MWGWHNRSKCWTCTVEKKIQQKPFGSITKHSMERTRWPRYWNCWWYISVRNIHTVIISICRIYRVSQIETSSRKSLMYFSIAYKSTMLILLVQPLSGSVWSKDWESTPLKCSKFFISQNRVFRSKINFTVHFNIFTFMGVFPSKVTS